MALKQSLLLALLIFLISAPSAISQTPAPAQDNLYSLALKASILQMEKEWGHLGQSAYVGVPPDYHHMLVQKDPIITDGLPTAFENHSVSYLEDEELVDRYHKLHNSFEILKVGPIRNEGSALKIVISTYWFSIEKGRRLFAYSDWSEVEFRYNCEQDAFVITSVKLGGI
jgi:hypothetical protein